MCSFEHEEYPSISVDPWFLITEYFNDDIGFLGGFGKAMQYYSMCQNICYGAQYILGYFERGIACSLSLFDMNNTPLIA